MSLLRLSKLALSFLALLGVTMFGQSSTFTSPLPTGVRLDAVGDVIDLGSMPLNLVVAPKRGQGCRGAQRMARTGHSGGGPQDADGHSDAAAGRRILRRGLLA